MLYGRGRRTDRDGGCGTCPMLRYSRGALCIVNLDSKAGFCQLDLLLKEEVQGGRPSKEELGVVLARQH